MAEETPSTVVKQVAEEVVADSTTTVPETAEEAVVEETSAVEVAKATEPEKEETPPTQPEVEEAKAEEPKADRPEVEEAKVEEVEGEAAKADEPPAGESTAGEPPAGEPEEELEDILEGVVKKKRLFGWAQKWLYFHDDPFPLENLSIWYEKHAKKLGPQAEEVNKELFETIAYATQTGKGLLLYSASKDTADHPQGAILLKDVEAVEQTKTSPQSHQFKIRTKSRVWEFADVSEKNVKSWIQTINKKVEEAKGLPSVDESESYKEAYSQLAKRTAFRRKPPQKPEVFSADEGEPEVPSVKKVEPPVGSEPTPEDTAQEPPKDEPVAESSTNVKGTKRQSILGTLFSKQKASAEPITAAKAPEETPTAEPTSEAPAPAPTEEAAAAADVGEAKAAEKTEEKRRTIFSFPLFQKKTPPPAAPADEGSPESAEDTPAATTAEAEVPKEEAAAPAPATEAKTPTKSILGTFFSRKAENKKDESSTPAPATTEETPVATTTDDAVASQPQPVVNGTSDEAPAETTPPSSPSVPLGVRLTSIFSNFPGKKAKKTGVAPAEPAGEEPKPTTEEESSAADVATTEPAKVEGESPKTEVEVKP